MSAWDRHREAEDQAEYAEMACSFHMAIDSSDDRAPGLLVQVVTSAVRSGNQRLWSVAYDLQQDVVKFGAASEQVAADRTRLASLCGPILN